MPRIASGRLNWRMISPAPANERTARIAPMDAAITRDCRVKSNAWPHSHLPTDDETSATVPTPSAFPRIINMK